MITVTCRCGKTAQVPDDKAGRRGKCPQCGAAIEIPNAVSNSVELASEGVHAAFDTFRTQTKPGSVMTGLGCLLLLLPFSGAPAWVYLGWIAGLAGFLLPLFGLFLLFVLSNRSHEPHKQKARDTVAQIERRHRLSREASLNLAWPLYFSPEVVEHGSISTSTFAAFVDAVWGPKTFEARKRKQIQESADPDSIRADFECGYCGAPAAVAQTNSIVCCTGCGRKLWVPITSACPNCARATPETVTFGPSAIGTVAGGVAGPVGALIGGALFGKEKLHFRCPQCGVQWASKLLEKPW